MKNTELSHEQILALKSLMVEHAKDIETLTMSEVLDFDYDEITAARRVIDAAHIEITFD